MEEFFLIWESSCRNFIEDLEFSCQEAKETRLKIHVFLRSDTPEKAMPPERDWIENHFTLTTCPYASEAAIISYLLERYATEKKEKEMWLEELDIGSTLILVADKDRKFEEVSAILKVKNPHLQVSEVNGKEKSILEVLENACRRCKLVFLTETETEEHFYLLHNYFCYNPECTEGRFYTESELQKHLENQTQCPLCREEYLFCNEEKRSVHMKNIHKIDEMASSRKTPTSEVIVCQFCPHKKFSSSQQKEIHMKNCHKKCNCSCGNYFNTREDYLDHFYSVYPLACFENRKCPQRFQSALYQARHHREDHFSNQPFYCIPCQQMLVNEGGYKTKICFKDEKSLRIHGMSIGHNEEEMFLSDFKESLKVDQPLLQRRAPSRTCSAINYC